MGHELWFCLDWVRERGDARTMGDILHELAHVYCYSQGYESHVDHVFLAERYGLSQEEVDDQSESDGEDVLAGWRIPEEIPFD